MQGLQFAIYANAKFAGKPASSGVDTYFNKLSLGEGLTASQEDPISARWSGYFWPPKSGTYEFSLTQVGSAVLTIDGMRIIDDETPTRPPAGAELFPIPMRVVQLELRAGRGYPIQLDYVSGTLAFHLFRFGIRPPAGTIDDAVRIARTADVAVVFVGVSTTSETEGADRRDMELYGPQNELVEAVAAVNPRTVVVLNNGSPLRLPWIERVSAVVEAWLPGQEGARAVAEVLLGMTNPCGKLPLTFPRRLEDNPSYLYYSNGRDAHYGEGVFVGYRYYEKKKIEPLFPFGHGLSFTTFEYSNLRAPDEVLAGQADPCQPGRDQHRHLARTGNGAAVRRRRGDAGCRAAGEGAERLPQGGAGAGGVADRALHAQHTRPGLLRRAPPRLDDDARKVSAVRGQLVGGHPRDALVHLDCTGRRARAGRAVDVRGRPLIWQPT